MFFSGMSRTIFFPSNTLIYGISRDGFKNFNIRTCEHMILGQLRMRARQMKNAPLLGDRPIQPIFTEHGWAGKNKHIRFCPQLWALHIQRSVFDHFTLKPINPRPYYNALTYVSIQPDMQKAVSLGSKLVLCFHQLCYFFKHFWNNQSHTPINREG